MSDDLAVPAGWTETTLGSLGKYINGRGFKTSEWSKTGRPIIRIQDLTKTSASPNFFDGTVDARHEVHRGDFLISWSATLGAYIWDGPEAVLNQHIFRVESKIDQRFHYHLVRQLINRLITNAHGSGMVHVTKGIFDSTPVVVPDELEVQKSLAKMIDQAEELRSSAAERIASAKASVDRYKKVILASACSGALTADWRSANPDALSVELAIGEATASQRGRRGRATKETSVDLPLPPLPSTYIVASISDCSERIEYGTSVRSDAPEMHTPVLRMGNIQDGHLDTSDLKYTVMSPEIKRLLLEDGDLLFNRTNSPELVGKSAVFHDNREMSFASYLIRVRFHPEVAVPDFVNYWLNSMWGRHWAQLAKTDGVSQSNINGTKLSLMPVPLPPIDEQHEIVRRVAEHLRLADELLDRLKRAELDVTRTSQAILNRIFADKVSITS